MRWRSRMVHAFLSFLLLSARSTALAETPPSADLPPVRALATGFFVDRAGHVLTARHAVEACSSVYLLRPGRVTPATVVAVDGTSDLALLSTPEAPALAGAFAATPPPPAGEAVFAASYRALQGGEMDGVLVNGIVPPQARAAGRATFQISSAAGAGTSGAPVVNGRGLVIGVVFARQQPASGRRRAGIAAPLMAVDGTRATAFLLDHGIRPGESAEASQQGELVRSAEVVRSYTVGIACAE